MRNWMLAAGAAALAMAAPTLADPGKGKGGSDKGPVMKAQHGGGPSMKAQKGGGPSIKADRGQGSKQDHPVRMSSGNSGKDHAKGGGSMKTKVDHADNRRWDKPGKSGKPVKPGKAMANDNRVKVRGDDDVRLVRRDFGDDAFFRNGRMSFDCPPGLDKKDNGCLPPGQAKKMLGAPLLASFADNRIPYEYRDWYRDNDRYYYRSGDGFIYRVDRRNNLVDGLIPLFGSGYYTMGDVWPDPYNFYNVPYQYRSYWPEGGDYAYRYGDGAIYRLDPTSGAVNAIVALLAGDLGVGRQLPVGYDVYNVPLAYRSQYYDTPDAWYRYNDGYIYRVDPTTRLITAVINAIT